MTLVTVWITTCQSLRSAHNGTLTSHTMMSATVARPPAPGRRRARHAVGRRSGVAPDLRPDPPARDNEDQSRIESLTTALQTYGAPNDVDVTEIPTASTPANSQ
jgi:hypothetical protein